MTARKKYQSVEEYFADFDGVTLQRLIQLQEIIHRIAPDSTERISYNIPACFIGKKMIVYYGGYAGHVALYPGRIADQQLDPALQPYSSGKSTLKFPHEQPLPAQAIESYILTRLAATKKE